MRVLEPHIFKGVKHAKSKRKRKLPLRRGLIFLIVGLYVTVAILRPLPETQATTQALGGPSKSPVNILWPKYGQAAVGAVGYGMLGTHGEQKALPTASVAKVMTALAVLKQKPLKIGETGPIITIDQDDVQEYYRTVAMDGSNVPVNLGEEITQYQALQALLLPSANNMAYTLAKWAYGSEESYLVFVNNFARSLGMQNTKFADASGYSSQTVSTSEDLVRLAVNAMDNPVIAQIAAQEAATIPVAGKIYNVNMLLGKNGVVGVKTGNTEEAGGCFMGAAVREVNGQKIIAVSVIMGAPNLSMALRDSVPLLNSVLSGFSEVTLAKAGQQVGTYEVPWGGSIPLTVEKDLKAVMWQEAMISPAIAVRADRRAFVAGDTVGRVTATSGRAMIESPVVITQNVSQPSLVWRLLPRL